MNSSSRPIYFSLSLRIALSTFSKFLAAAPRRHDFFTFVICPLRRTMSQVCLQFEPFSLWWQIQSPRSPSPLLFLCAQLIAFARLSVPFKWILFLALPSGQIITPSKRRVSELSVRQSVRVRLLLFNSGIALLSEMTTAAPPICHSSLSGTK